MNDNNRKLVTVVYEIFDDDSFETERRRIRKRLDKGDDYKVVSVNCLDLDEEKRYKTTELERNPILDGELMDKWIAHLISTGLHGRNRKEVISSIFREGLDSLLDGSLFGKELAKIGREHVAEKAS